MTVIVHNMKLPGNCLRCDFLRCRTGQAPYCARLLNYVDDLSERQPDCPLEEVPDKRKCRNCKYLEITGAYGECSRGYLGIVSPQDFCSRGYFEVKGEEEAR